MRARRGQATDSHSLAERVKFTNFSIKIPKLFLPFSRKLIIGVLMDVNFLGQQVRRGKINDKLRCLQDIVPGCYKVSIQLPQKEYIKISN